MRRLALTMALLPALAAPTHADDTKSGGFALGLSLTDTATGFLMRTPAWKR